MKTIWIDEVKTAGGDIFHKPSNLCLGIIDNIIDKTYDNDDFWEKLIKLRLKLQGQNLNHLHSDDFLPDFSSYLDELTATISSVFSHPCFGFNFIVSGIPGYFRVGIFPSNRIFVNHTLT